MESHIPRSIAANKYFCEMRSVNSKFSKIGSNESKISYKSSGKGERRVIRQQLLTNLKFSFSYLRRNELKHNIHLFYEKGFVYLLFF